MSNAEPARSLGRAGGPINPPAFQPVIVAPPTAPRLTVLAPKLRAPRLPFGSIRRERLLDILNEGIERKTTIVSAPAGYGKTTLLSQWVAHSDLPVAWVSLDANDNDPLTFFLHMISAIQQIDATIAPRTRELLEGPAQPVMTVVGSLLNELSELTRQLILVLDDLHTVTLPEIQEGLTRFIDFLPQPIHLVITSRDSPPLPIVKMRARGELTELDASDLRFINNETFDLLLRQTGLRFESGDIETLESVTEGWATGLLLLAHAMRNNPGGDVLELAKSLRQVEQDVAGYLWSDVLDQQDPDIQSFLLSISILDRFSVDLCHAVTGHAGSSEKIAYLDRANLFLVKLEGQGDWFRLHHLMTAANRQRLGERSTPDAIRELHSRAAAWFELHDMNEDAARHAIAGADWERALRLLPGICGELHRQDRLSALQTWLQDVPAHVLTGNPDLSYWHAWALARTGKFQAAMMPLDAAERAWAESQNVESLAAAQSLYMLRDIIRSDLASALERGAQALDVLPEHRRQDRAVLYVLTGLAHHYGGELDAAERDLVRARSLASDLRISWLHLIEMNTSGSVLLARGKLRDAAALFSRVIATGDPWNHLPVQHAIWLLASIEIERNQLDAAEEHLQNAAKLATRMGAILHPGQIYQLMADIAWAQGHPADAFEALEQAIRYAELVDAPLFMQTALARRARYWLSNGQTILARRWADDCDLDPLLPFDHLRIYEYLTMARVLLYGGEVGITLQSLHAMEAQAETAGRVLDLIEILVLRSIAHQRNDKPEAAIESLTRAIELGAPEGFCRVFLAEGVELRRLLRRVFHNSPHRNYVSTLLAALDGMSPSQQPEPVSLTSLLSVRELEVLRLVAIGESNSEIADHLFISEPTVKKHISNILGKLQVTNRTRAVDQARQLGLI